MDEHPNSDCNKRPRDNEQEENKEEKKAEQKSLLLVCSDGTMECPEELMCAQFIRSYLDCEDCTNEIPLPNCSIHDVKNFLCFFLGNNKKQRKTTTNIYILRLCRAAWVGLYLGVPFSWRPLAQVCTNAGLMRAPNESPVVQAFLSLFPHESAWRAFLSEMTPEQIRKWINNTYNLNDVGMLFFTSKVKDLKDVLLQRISFPYDVFFKDDVRKSPLLHGISVLLG
jgi:hypothetical protein